MNKIISVVKDFILHVVHRSRDKVHDEQRIQLIDEIECARKEWREVVLKFENALDPDVIPQLAYDIKTKERRYIYLLERIRAEGCKLNEDEFYARIIIA